VFLIIDHNDIGVLRNDDGLVLYITDLPTLVSFKVIEQELVTLEDDEGLSHLFPFLKLESIVFFFHGCKSRTLAIHVFFIVTVIVDRSLDYGSRFCLWHNLRGDLDFLDHLCFRNERRRVSHSLDDLNAVITFFNLLSCHLNFYSFLN